MVFPRNRATRGDAWLALAKALSRATHRETQELLQLVEKH
jgi:hypothetical protein